MFIKNCEIGIFNWFFLLQCLEQLFYIPVSFSFHRRISYWSPQPESNSLYYFTMQSHWNSKEKWGSILSSLHFIMLLYLSFLKPDCEIPNNWLQHCILEIISELFSLLKDNQWKRLWWTHLTSSTVQVFMTGLLDSWVKSSTSKLRWSTSLKNRCCVEDLCKNESVHLY